jgi:hypothetical protein
MIIQLQIEAILWANRPNESHNSPHEKKQADRRLEVKLRSWVDWGGSEALILKRESFAQEHFVLNVVKKVKKHKHVSSQHSWIQAVEFETDGNISGQIAMYLLDEVRNAPWSGGFESRRTNYRHK